MFTTLPADGDVPAFARRLVQERLVACVTAHPQLQSVYRWRDDIEEEREQQIVLKTARDRVEALWKRVRQLHPYEVPEFLVVPIIDGNAAYLKWIRDSTTPDTASEQLEHQEAADQERDEDHRR